MTHPPIGLPGPAVTERRRQHRILARHYLPQCRLDRNVRSAESGTGRINDFRGVLHGGLRVRQSEILVVPVFVDGIFGWLADQDRLRVPAQCLSVYGRR
jgi:hypothetical protein